jgi:hypothetical protein
MQTCILVTDLPLHSYIEIIKMHAVAKTGCVDNAKDCTDIYHGHLAKLCELQGVGLVRARLLMTEILSSRLIDDALL